MKKLLCVAVVCAMVSFYAMPLFAVDADQQWDGGGGDALWATAANWNGTAGPVPLPGDTAVFNNAAGGNTTITAGTNSVRSLYFDDAVGTSYTIQTGTLTLGNVDDTGAITVTGNVTAAQTISADITLAGSYAFTNNAGAASGGVLQITGAITGAAAAETLTLKGTNTDVNYVTGNIIDGAGALSVTKAEAGKWILSGAKTYTGTTEVSGGTLIAHGNAGALGAGALTMSGGTLQLCNDTDLAFNRNTTVTASSRIDSVVENAASAGSTHTLGTLSIGAFTLMTGIGDGNTTSGTQGLTFGAVTLTGNASITATSGYGGTATGLLTLGNVTSAGNKLTLESDSATAITMGTMTNLAGGLTITDAGGLVTVGEIGTEASGAGNVTITDSQAGVTFSGAATIDKATITNTAGGQTVTFAGNTTIDTLETTANGYSVAFTGTTNTITTDTDFLNTGAVTLGNGAGDTTTFTGGVNTTTGPTGTNVAGIVQTTDTDMDLCGTTMDAATTLRSGSGAINVASVTDGVNSYALSLGSASQTGAVTITGNATFNTLTTFAGAYDLIFQGTTTTIDTDTDFLNTGTVTLGDGAGDTTTFTAGLNTTAAVGPTATNVAGTLITTDTQMDLGATTITAASTIRSGSAATNIASVTDGAGSFALTLGNAAQTGAMTISGNATFNTLTTAAGAYNIIFQGTTTTIDTDTSFLNTGTVTFGNGAGDTTTFTGGLATAGSGTNPSGTNVAGTLATTNTQMDLGATTLTAASSITTGGGVLNIASVNNGGFLLTIDAGAGASAITGAATGDGGLTKNGAGTLTLGGVNTYAGTTTINAGMVDLTGSLADTGAVSLADVASASLRLNGNETIGSLSGGGTTGGNVNLNGANTLTVGDATSTTYAGVISGAGGGLTKEGAGTLTLSNANTYTGDTTINTGTLKVTNADALGGVGGGNVDQTATLDIGSTILNIGGTYTQNGAATLMVSVSGTTAGKIVAGGACTVTATDSLVLAVSNYVPTGTTYTIIDGTGGAGIAAPVITVTGDTHVTFTASAVGEDLILTASRTSNGFASEAKSGDSNAAAVGNVLDNITSPSSDMSIVLNELGGLSSSQVGDALDTLVPQVDAGIINNTTASFNNGIGAVIERVETTLRVARADTARTGISAGDSTKLNGIWAKGYGSYLSQDLRKGIQGYDAWNAGTALGVDRLFGDVMTVGVSGGYAYGNVDSDANNAKTYINTAQTTLYAGYQDRELPYFIDVAGSFGWNWYNGKRDIAVGTINRTANAAYDGQQYGVYAGGGYEFKPYKDLEFTPLLSLGWNHLHLQSYTETEAGALNLSVASQDYDLLQSGVGARVAYPIKCAWGTFVPEGHGKWLYDFIGDKFAVTSNFNGGGASFDSNGCPPAQHSFNIGGKMLFAFKNDISLLGECDTELKEDFWGIYGSVTVRYNF